MSATASALHSIETRTQARPHEHQHSSVRKFIGDTERTTRNGRGADRFGHTATHIKISYRSAIKTLPLREGRVANRHGEPCPTSHPRSTGITTRTIRSICLRVLEELAGRLQAETSIAAADLQSIRSARSDEQPLQVKSSGRGWRTVEPAGDLVPDERPEIADDILSSSAGPPPRYPSGRPTPGSLTARSTSPKITASRQSATSPPGHRRRRRRTLKPRSHRKPRPPGPAPQRTPRRHPRPNRPTRRDPARHR